MDDAQCSVANDLHMIRTRIHTTVGAPQLSFAIQGLLVEAVEEGYVKPGANILVPAFGAGLTWSSHLISWGERVKPLGTNDVDLPPCDKSGLELVQSYLAQQRPHQGITD